MKMKTITSLFAACFALGVVAADAAEISRVSVRQRWPWSRLVDIDYVLACDSTQRLDIAVSAYNGSDPLDVPASSFSGDLYGLSYGAHHIVWDPTVTSCTNTGVLPEFRVALTMTNSPVYMIVALTNLVAGIPAPVEYICPGDPRLETYGPYTNVWFGVTNGTLYKTDAIVLRRIQAGSFKAGPEEGTQASVTLTKDFYVGVFEVTAGQWYRITGSGSLSTAAKGSVKYNDTRGATNDSPKVDWPSTGHSVTTNSFIGLLRTKTGINGFDLPTEAQWEYMSRAGTTTYFNDGIEGTSTNQLNEIGWWFDNRAGNPSHYVGLKTANFWGIYDTIGNQFECCLDWYGAPLAAGIDPVGPTSADTGKRVAPHGGCYYSAKTACRSSVRETPYAPTWTDGHFGVRIVIHLP
jgi:formylglycine-generating enzyme required for sulfatase activity